MLHDLRLDSKPFDDLQSELRSFKIVYFDKDYKSGDFVRFREFKSAENYGYYTRREAIKKIVHVESFSSGLRDNYVLLLLKNLTKRELARFTENAIPGFDQQSTEPGIKPGAARA